MKFNHFTPRDLYFGMILRCPECQKERREARGIIRVGRRLDEVWYLGCECPPPNGMMKV